MTGPSLCSGDGYSEMFAKVIVTGAIPAIPKQVMGFVDVRDVALAHLNGVKIEKAKNRRFLVCCESYWFRDVA